MNQLALRSKFNEVFKKEKLYFFAPGRVNLIGEHTDYNGGHVFPCALSFGTHCVFCKRDDKKIRLYSLNFPEKGIIDADLSAISYDKNKTGPITRWGSSKPCKTTAIILTKVLN